MQESFFLLRQEFVSHSYFLALEVRSLFMGERGFAIVRAIGGNWRMLFDLFCLE